MINPHNPEFITKVPWYLGNHGPTLKHHNIQKNDHVLSLTETDELVSRKLEAQREARMSAPKTVYRKGACKNCGALTHKEKDCLERPRSSKTAAWKTGLDIAADEVVLKMENHGKVSYAAKRDSWTGYDPTEYQEVIARHEKMEEERKKEKMKQRESMQKVLEEKARAKAERRAAKAAARTNKGKVSDVTSDEVSDASDSDSDSDGGSDDEDDEDVGKEFLARDDEAVDFQDTMAPQGGLGGAGMRQTVRNLRIREDTPKYLRNLDLDSAFYDPKSRSMRSNPHPGANPEELPFAGDNFIRYSGDAVKLAQNQLLCWEMQARGENIDVVSNPSQAEFLHKVVAEKKATAQSARRKEVLDKYLDGQEAPTMDPRLRLGQTETYLEYTRDGRIKGPAVQPVSSARTKYEEDVLINNHTSVWGSYYSRMTSSWGYACCHSLLKNSYCTGHKGKEANDSAHTAASLDSFQLKRMLEKDQSTAGSRPKAEVTSRSDLFGEANAAKQLDEKKLQEALQRAEGSANGSKAEAKKRGYNSMSAAEVTAEDMEVYRMKKAKAEDPMANYVDQE